MSNDILKAAQWQHGARQSILRTYLRLHEGKLGSHWLWSAMERIAAGESEESVMSDFGYQPAPLS